jgi:hypothetical protein
VTALQHLDAGRTVGGLEHLEAFTRADLTQQNTNLRIIVDEKQ